MNIGEIKICLLFPKFWRDILTKWILNHTFWDIWNWLEIQKNELSLRQNAQKCKNLVKSFHSTEVFSSLDFTEFL